VPRGGGGRCDEGPVPDAQRGTRRVKSVGGLAGGGKPRTTQGRITTAIGSMAALDDPPPLCVVYLRSSSSPNATRRLHQPTRWRYHTIKNRRPQRPKRTHFTKLSCRFCVRFIRTFEVSSTRSLGRPSRMPLHLWMVCRKAGTQRQLCWDSLRKSLPGYINPR
jgi:hypothetical protein